MIKSITMSYYDACNDFFAPLDEICEAIDNKEGCAGLTHAELLRAVDDNHELAVLVKLYDKINFTFEGE